MSDVTAYIEQIRLNLEFLMLHPPGGMLTDSIRASLMALNGLDQLLQQTAGNSDVTPTLPIKRRKKSRIDNWVPTLTANAPWTPGPWRAGEAPFAHCRIIAKSSPHAIARTYGPDLNGIGVCRLTGPENHADAVLISMAPVMMEVCARLAVFDSSGADPNDSYDLLVATRLGGMVLDEVVEMTTPKKSAARRGPPKPPNWATQ